VPNAFSRSKSFDVGSWRSGANYAASDSLDLFGNLSTGFRAPSAEQLYNGSISPTSTKVENNENLKPEQAFNMELGAPDRLRSALRVEVPSGLTRRFHHQHRRPVRHLQQHGEGAL
jgi:outer membrane receptor protein involved in Fe transport